MDLVINLCQCVGLIRALLFCNNKASDTPPPMSVSLQNKKKRTHPHTVSFMSLMQLWFCEVHNRQINKHTHTNIYPHNEKKTENTHTHRAELWDYLSFQCTVVHRPCIAALSWMRVIHSSPAC